MKIKFLQTGKEGELNPDNFEEGTLIIQRWENGSYSGYHLHEIRSDELLCNPEKEPRKFLVSCEDNECMNPLRVDNWIALGIEE